MNDKTDEAPLCSDQETDKYLVKLPPAKPMYTPLWYTGHPNSPIHHTVSPRRDPLDYAAGLVITTLVLAMVYAVGLLIFGVPIVLVPFVVLVLLGLSLSDLKKEK